MSHGKNHEQTLNKLKMEQRRIRTRQINKYIK